MPVKKVYQDSYKDIYKYVKDEYGIINKDDFIVKLEKLGILRDDPRISITIELLEKYGTFYGDDDCFNCLSKGITILENAFSHFNVIGDFEGFERDVRTIYDEVKPNIKGETVTQNYDTEGSTKQDNNYFGLAICTINGQRLKLGDTDVKYCVENCSSPINYCLGLKERGVDEVHKYVGLEPSGNEHNVLKLNDEGIPHNPLNDAGSIMICSLLKREMQPEERYDYILKTWEQLSGGKKVEYADDYNFIKGRNTTIAHFMKEGNAFPPDTNIHEVLNFLNKCCSLLVDTDQISIVAATLANGGVCPLNGKQIIPTDCVQHCLSLMFTCGMHDYSGEFAYRFGLPSNANSAGGVMFVVIPNLMGICLFSPNLDEYGNSMRGVEFISRFTNKFNVHLLEPNRSDSSKEYLGNNALKRVQIDRIHHYTSRGDLSALKRLHITRRVIYTPDYDRRTLLHHAACSGHLDVVKYIIVKGGLSLVNATDRWGGTPYDDAAREGYVEVANFLLNLGGVAACKLKDGNSAYDEKLSSAPDFDDMCSCGR